MSSNLTMSSSTKEELEMTQLCLGIGGAGGPRPGLQVRGSSKNVGIRGGDGGGDHRSNGGMDPDNDGGTRKKLRLTEEQASLLEASFRAHDIPSHGEKHDLARHIGLRPRQVEVWFQNRRAQAKIKKTELDRNLLRQRCEQLSTDNTLLRCEISNLRSYSAVSRLAASSVHDGEGCSMSTLQQDLGGLTKTNRSMELD